MSLLQLQDDLNLKQVAQKRKQALSIDALNIYTLFSDGMLPVAVSKFRTSSPIQMYKIRGILRANRALALVVQEPSVV